MVQMLHLLGLWEISVFTLYLEPTSSPKFILLRFPKSEK